MKCVYVVGRYKPAGNFIGQFPSNVNKGSFDEATYCGKNGKPNQSPGSPPTPKIGQSTGFQLPSQIGKPSQALGSFLPAGTSSPGSPTGTGPIGDPTTGTTGGPTVTGLLEVPAGAALTIGSAGIGPSVGPTGTGPDVEPQQLQYLL